MSRENVKLVRRGFDLFNRGEIEAWAKTLDPDVEWHANPQDPETAVHHGRAAATRYALEWAQSLGSLSQEVLDVFDAGEHVVAWVRLRGRGETSGVPVEQHLAYVFTLRDGLVVTIRETQDKAEAFQAVGLRE